MPCIHHEARHDIVVYTMDSRLQMPLWGRNRPQSSTDHSARSHRLSVGVSGQVAMVPSPIEGLRYSHRPIHPLKTGRQMAVGPPLREASYMQVGGRIPAAGLLRGLRRSIGGASLGPRRRGVVCVVPARLFWGVCAFPSWGDCVAVGGGP